MCCYISYLAAFSISLAPAVLYVLVLIQMVQIRRNIQVVVVTEVVAKKLMLMMWMINLETIIMKMTHKTKQIQFLMLKDLSILLRCSINLLQKKVFQGRAQNNLVKMVLDTQLLLVNLWMYSGRVNYQTNKERIVLKFEGFFSIKFQSNLP